MPKMKFERSSRKQINLQIPDVLLDKIEGFMKAYPYVNFSGIILQALDEFIDSRMKYGDQGARNPDKLLNRNESKNKTEYREDIMPDGSYGPDHNPDPSKFKL